MRLPGTRAGLASTWRARDAHLPDRARSCRSSRRRRAAALRPRRRHARCEPHADRAIRLAAACLLHRACDPALAERGRVRSSVKRGIRQGLDAPQLRRTGRGRPAQRVRACLLSCRGRGVAAASSRARADYADERGGADLLFWALGFVAALALPHPSMACCSRAMRLRAGPRPRCSGWRPSERLPRCSASGSGLLLAVANALSYDVYFKVCTDGADRAAVARRARRGASRGNPGCVARGHLAARSDRHDGARFLAGGERAAARARARHLVGARHYRRRIGWDACWARHLPLLRAHAALFPDCLLRDVERPFQRRLPSRRQAMPRSARPIISPIRRRKRRRLRHGARARARSPIGAVSIPRSRA